MEYLKDVGWARAGDRVKLERMMTDVQKKIDECSKELMSDFAGVRCDVKELKESYKKRKFELLVVKHLINESINGNLDAIL